MIDIKGWANNGHCKQRGACRAKDGFRFPVFLDK